MFGSQNIWGKTWKKKYEENRRREEWRKINYLKSKNKFYLVLS